MSSKSERTRSKMRGIKILNDEQINTLPTLPTMSCVPLSPTKHITMTIGKNKESPSPKRRKNMDHYVLHTIKGETDDEGCVGETIDFIHTDDGEEKPFAPSGEITEELHISDGENVEDDHPMSDDVKTEEIIEHVCGKCYKSFRRVSGLKKHLDFCRFDSGYGLRKAEMLKNIEKIEKDAVIMENKDICFCCGESFDTCHLGHINCPDCPKSFKSQSSYERHIFITHSEFNDYPCTVCNAKLRSKNLLKLHTEQHMSRGKPYACKICGKDFTRPYHLKRHQKYSSCSADVNDAMYCKVCNKVFFRLDNLRAHLKQHLGELSKKKSEYMCSICKNNFYSLSTLNIHTRTHTGERPFDCDLCDKKFPSLVALKKHRRYHTGEKPYSCGVCSQSFAVKEVLNRHMKRHTGERPHVCPECKKSFIQATQLKNHLRTHLRPFECKDCDEKFKTEKQLIRHEKVHKSHSQLKKRDNHCKICNMYFLPHNALMRHLKSKQHLILEEARKNRRTDCAICEKNFDTAQNLEFHILKVHEVDPEEFINEKPAAAEKSDVPTDSQCIKIEKVVPEEPKLINDDDDMEFISLSKTNNDKIAAGGKGFGVVVQEFIVDELPTTSNANTIFLNNDAYTIIPLDSDGVIETKAVQQTSPTGDHTKDSKSGVRKSLAESLAEAIADAEDDDNEEDSNENTSKEDDEKLNHNVTKLLDMLVDKTTLKKFGWPESSVENVLCKVIENCGHDLSRDDNYKHCEYSSRMREYVKLMFTVVIQNDSIKELLNNYPIDEVIEYVLGNDEDEEEEEEDTELVENAERCSDNEDSL